MGGIEDEALASIWNIKYEKNMPQQILTSMVIIILEKLFKILCNICFIIKKKSLITSICFSPFHPNLIHAGTYSGQIQMWDIRCNKQTPIQRSSLSNNSHLV